MSLNIRNMAGLLPMSLLLGGLMFGVFWSRHAEHFPIKIIEIKDRLQYLTSSEVEQALVPHLNQGFFWINIQELQQKLLSLPWVFKASIKRSWPDKLIVSLLEHSPLARFNKEAVLSQEGVLFYPSAETLASLSPDLPQFWGKEETAKSLFEAYRAFGGVLRPLNLSIAELNADKAGIKLLLSNGVAVILGKESQQERLQFLVKVYVNGLKEKLENIAYLDLRYTRGLAIGWKMDGKELK